MSYTVPKIELIEVKVLSYDDGMTVQRLTFQYKYRRGTYQEHIYLTDYHLKGEQVINVSPIEKKTVDKDYIAIAIQMLYYNVHKKLTELNKNR